MMPVRLCLVTGASGFLGRQLLPLLWHAGWRVRALQHHTALDAAPSDNTASSIEILRGDINDKSLDLDRLLQGVDTVFHLAATAHTAANAAIYRADCEAAVRLAREAGRRGVRALVHVSSTRAMAAPGALCRDESWLEWPADAYGYWKRTTEQRLLDETDVLPHLAIVRPCLMYGPGVKGNLRQMVAAIERDRFPALPEAGRRSLVAAADVAAALLLLADEPRANRQVFIAADDTPLTACAMAGAIAQALARPPPSLPVSVGLLRVAGWLGDGLSLLWPRCPLDSALVSRLLDPAQFSAAALRALGWRPQWRFEEALPAMIEAYHHG